MRRGEVAVLSVWVLVTTQVIAAGEQRGARRDRTFLSGPVEVLVAGSDASADVDISRRVEARSPETDLPAVQLGDVVDVSVTEGDVGRAEVRMRYDQDDLPKG